MTTAAAPRGLMTWLPGLVLLALLLGLFHQTAADMVHIWIRSDTFQHAFLVLPIAAWLVWRRRDQLVGVELHPVPWLLAPMAATCFVWLLGHLADVAAAMQLALVTVIVLAVPALFGWRLTRVVAFPLLFLYFMVPFGEFAVPALQDWTADVTVLALRLTGIPVYREGMQFVIPTGTWSVVEACSGIRYLIACFMVGTLFAYLNFRSTQRRLVFVLASLLVPVIANWIRAYTIVMIGHLTGSPMILGVEHTTYGWFLFGAVVMVMFWVGSHWAEPDANPVTRAPSRYSPAPAVRTVVPGSGVASAAAALLLGTHLWAMALVGDRSLPAPALEMPRQLGDWQQMSAESSMDWMPGFINPSATTTRTYGRQGSVVTVWVGYYAEQTDDRKLVTSMHRVVANEDKNWRSQMTGRLASQHDLPAFPTAIVSTGRAPSLSVPSRQRVWYAYWLDGRWLISPAEVKLRQALARLLGESHEGAIVMFVTPMAENADEILGKFARESLVDLGAALERTRESGGSPSH